MPQGGSHALLYNSAGQVAWTIPQLDAGIGTDAALDMNIDMDTIYVGTSSVMENVAGV